MLAAQGIKKAVFILGYVGERFCRDVLKTDDNSIVKIGDHIGFCLEEAAKKDIEEVLLIGHIGKLIKVAAGQFNTHFSFGDNRIASIARYAKANGADKKITEEILQETSSEATIEILRKNGLMKVFNEVVADVLKKGTELVGNKMKIDCIILSLEGEILAMTTQKGSDPLIKIF